MDDLHDSYMLATNSNSDVLRGGAGDDVLRSAGGADVLDGGSGFDTAYVFRLESATNYVIDIRSGGGGTDIGDGTQLSNVEVLDFYGSSGNDTVVGGDFADYVFSDSGQDWLGGCGGDDRLQGGDGEDHIKGGSGDDRISGGNSRDVLNGGAGADTFVYADAAESIAGDEHDVITDFESGMDRIDLSYLKTMISGSTISYVGSSSFTGEAGELRHSFTAGGSAFIQLDLDGNGIADFEIKLTGQVALGISDFVI